MKPEEIALQRITDRLTGAQTCFSCRHMVAPTSPTHGYCNLQLSMRDDSDNQLARVNLTQGCVLWTAIRD
jgi:hypothetical protein